MGKTKLDPDVAKALKIFAQTAGLASLAGGLYYGTKKYLKRRKLIKKLKEMGYSPEIAKLIAKNVLPTSGIMQHYIGSLLGVAGISYPNLAPLMPAALYMAFSKRNAPDWAAAQFGIDLSSV
ncbi:MAG: hypothetical protein QXT77_07200 [Candidatus Methanomethylicaceae archaeon]